MNTKHCKSERGINTERILKLIARQPMTATAISEKTGLNFKYVWSILVEQCAAGKTSRTEHYNALWSGSPIPVVAEVPSPAQETSRLIVECDPHQGRTEREREYWEMRDAMGITVVDHGNASPSRRGKYADNLKSQI